MRALIVLVFLVAGCASAQPVAREGPLAGAPLPQAAEQCAAQPQLDWCPK